jgi:hypothetical protein
VFDQIYQRLLRFDALRHAQWFFKSEPSGFTVVTGLGHPCQVLSQTFWNIGLLAKL